MREIPVSEFRAKCSYWLEHVRRTKQAIRVVREGSPFVEVHPVPETATVDRAKWIGSLQGSAETLGDIVSPANDEDDWEVLRD
jgi:hypothetical protein